MKQKRFFLKKKEILFLEIFILDSLRIRLSFFNIFVKI
jgi:hypothetical protein